MLARQKKRLASELYETYESVPLGLYGADLLAFDTVMESYAVGREAEPSTTKDRVSRKLNSPSAKALKEFTENMQNG